MKLFKSVYWLLVLAIPLSVHSQHVQFSNPLPEAGSIVKFSYDPVGTSLDGQEKIDCQAYLFTKKKPNLTKVNKSLIIDVMIRLLLL